MDQFIPFIAKIIAPFVVAFCVWTANRTGIVSLSGAQFTDSIVALIVWFLTEITHTFISKKTNPSNAASTTLAVVDKERNTELNEANRKASKL